MSFYNEVLEVVKLFEANWDSDATPVAYPNYDFQPPKGNWARLTMIEADSDNVEIGSPGSNQQSASGAIIINIFSLIGGGFQTGGQLADAAALIFKNASPLAVGSTGNLTFRPPVIREIGEDVFKGTTYHLINVSVPYVSNSVT